MTDRDVDQQVLLQWEQPELQTFDLDDVENQFGMGGDGAPPPANRS